MERRRLTGQLGERVALAYLLDRGFREVRRNYRCTLGELDLVMLDGDTLVFVEVRTRRGAGGVRPEESVDAQKQKQLAKLAHHYLQSEGGWSGPWRVDVVAVTLGREASVEQVVHIEHAVEDADGW